MTIQMGEFALRTQYEDIPEATADDIDIIQKSEGHSVTESLETPVMRVKSRSKEQL